MIGVGKFFKKESKKCSICGKSDFPIVKKLRKGLLVLYYCSSCYNKYQESVSARIREIVEQKKKEGKKIGLKETLQIVKEISNQPLKISEGDTELEKKP